MYFYEEKAITLVFLEYTHSPINNISLQTYISLLTPLANQVRQRISKTPDQGKWAPKQMMSNCFPTATSKEEIWIPRGNSGGCVGFIPV